MKRIEILKQIQADSMVFFMKLHNFHWNVKGSDFMEVHKTTQEIYEIFAQIFDDVAERILQLNSKPLITLKEILKVTKIKENTKDTFKGSDIVKFIQEDYEYFLNIFKELSNECKEDSTTQDYANSQIAHLEKALWMLKAQL